MTFLNIKNNKRRIISILFILFTFSLLFLSYENGKIHSDTNSINHPISIKYIAHSPIEIYNDSAFVTYGFEGDGSETTPYLIEGFEFNITNDIGIHIVGTTKHFIIRDCFFNDSTNGDNNYGIYIVFTASDTCIIENNIIENAFIGISVSNSPSALIKNNTLYDSAYGISVSSSNSAIITENNTTRCYNAGGVIVNSGSDYLITKHTSLLDNVGIWVTYVDSAMIKENNCTKSNQGIEIYDSQQVTVLDNDLIEMTRPAGKTSSPSIVISWSQYVSVLDNRILNNQENYGVDLYNSNNTEFLYNHIDYNSLKGINLQNSNDVFIGNNNVTNNGEEGVYAEDCYNLAIVANEISFNSVSGIKFVNTNTSNINYNNITNNSPNYGIYLDTTSEDNIIHHNNFIENTPASPQAIDDGIGNIWYDTLTNEGNYWNDYVGPGNYALDGIAGSEDPYPLSAPTDFIIISEYNGNYLTILVLLGFLTIPLVSFIHKKRRK
jgi:parallel beta-helix repeat protein